MCYWEGSAPEFVNERWIVKSRCSHTCCECGNKIQKGAKYKVISGKWDGYFDSFQQCELCARIWEDLVDMEFCPDFGGLWEYIGEEFEECEEN